MGTERRGPNEHDEGNVIGPAVRIGPSILAADFLRLGEQIAEAEAAGADFIHVDVMDGRFVPNISVGLPVIAAVRAATKLPIDVHLMIVEPNRWVERVVAAGADLVSVHVEADPHLHRTLRAIEEAGGQPSVTLNPATPLVMLEEVVGLVRQVLVMSVNPGFGGQTFIPATLERVKRLRAWLDERNPTCGLEVDGGIKASNVRRVVAAGADTLVVGTAVFNHAHGLGAGLRELRTSIAAPTGHRPR